MALYKRLKQNGSGGSPSSPDFNDPLRSRTSSASTPPSDEYLIALAKVNKAKGSQAKTYYQMKADKINMIG